MSNSLDHYFKTYNGTQLLKKHTLVEEGVWKIVGEDPNCDLGGVHHNPDIGTFSGTLGDAVKYAVEQKLFWTWGGGGIITKIGTLKEPEEEVWENKLLEVVQNMLNGVSYEGAYYKPEVSITWYAKNGDKLFTRPLETPTKVKRGDGITITYDGELVSVEELVL